VPPARRGFSAERLQIVIERNIEYGVGSARVRPGVLKAASGRDGPVGFEFRALRAVARAQARHDLPLVTHAASAARRVGGQLSRCGRVVRNRATARTVPQDFGQHSTFSLRFRPTDSRLTSRGDGPHQDTSREFINGNRSECDVPHVWPLGPVIAYVGITSVPSHSRRHRAKSTLVPRMGSSDR
jgi:hypothetical protein